jgi:hypothetical protein
MTSIPFVTKPGLGNSRHPTLVVLSQKGELLPLTEETHCGKPIVKYFGKYEENQILPAEEMDHALMRRAVQLMPGNRVQILLDENPPKSGPTVGIDITKVVITKGEWRPTQFMVEFSPPSGDFSFKVERYTISMRDKVFSIIY